MKTLTLAVCAVLSILPAQAEPLSSADREALLESLEKLRESADSKVDARFRLAIAAYRDALQSDETAMDFYLKCIEKVNFEDQMRKNADFRDWKRKEAEKLSQTGFKLALRYQLRWLVLTLKASSEKADTTELAIEAQEIVDSLFRDSDKLPGQLGVLDNQVGSTVFAQAYEIANAGKEGWPQSPVQLDVIYDKVIFPQLRTLSRLETLRASWIKRIQQEGIRTEWPDNADRKPGEADPKAADKERFLAERLPELQWDMEMDLFRSGDQSGAAMRMLAHIEKHLSHKSAREWGDQLKKLLAPAPAPATPAETPPGA